MNSKVMVIFMQNNMHLDVGYELGFGQFLYKVSFIYTGQALIQVFVVNT